MVMNTGTRQKGMLFLFLFLENKIVNYVKYVTQQQDLFTNTHTLISLCPPDQFIHPELPNPDPIITLQDLPQTHPPN